MKFEKFFKKVGTHGVIVKRNDRESWLVCGLVGMRIPEGVNNLGVSENPDELFTAIMNSDSADDVLALKRAILNDAEGKANDIIRVFETDLGDEVGIYNDSFGLIEKKDVLTYLEIEDEDSGIDHKVIVVSNIQGDIIGYIFGTKDYIC